MASITFSGGRATIQFVDVDTKRKSIRLGSVPKRTAEAIKLRVEALLNAKITNTPVDRDTAAWLAGIGTDLADKLASAGLIDARADRFTVGQFLSGWIKQKAESGFKATSLRAWRQTADAMTDQFGSKPLASFTHTDGESFRAKMQASGLRPTTIQKRLGHARQFFGDAVRLGQLPANPFQYVKHRGGDVSERRAYVAIADARRVMDFCPSGDWRLLVALARFGGLRVPSEAFSLTWSDVDWERGRLTVPSPKTEHLGKPHRVIPLFPLLRPHLEAAFEQAPEGSVFIFSEKWRGRSEGKDGWGGANLRTTFAKIVRRAGLEPWPRIWHSLRASCESDLAQAFPLATVTKWLGNTPSVALRHYVDPTETAFEQAKNWVPDSAAESGAVDRQTMQNPVQSVFASDEQELTQPVDSLPICHRLSPQVLMCQGVKRECMGIEPTESFVQTLHWF